MCVQVVPKFRRADCVADWKKIPEKDTGFLDMVITGDHGFTSMTQN